MHRVARTRIVRGVEVPSFFYGTAWKEERTAPLVAQALALGFRAIDTANQRKHYVEAGVGESVRAALDAGSIRREELFLQTKFTFRRGQDRRLPYEPGAPIATQVAQSFESSLEHLGVTKLDSLLLHGPASGRGLVDDDWEVWRAFERLHDERRVRLLGVSNVTLEQLAGLVAGSRVQPAFVQNRCYARTRWDAGIRAFCSEHDVVYQGFSLLTANATELQTQAVGRVAERVGRTRAAVVFRFALELGMIPLTGSSNADHLRRDLECFDFELTPEEIATLERVSTLA